MSFTLCVCVYQMQASLWLVGLVQNMKDKKNQEELDFLSAYNPEDYERPSVTVDIALLAIGNDEVDNYRKLPEKRLKVLLIKREEHPFKDNWALPGVFATPNETLEESAIRGLKKETGIDNIYLEQLYTISTPNRDPRTWVITCAYMALVQQEKVGDLSDSEATDWFNVSLKVVKEQREQKEGIIISEIYYELELTKEKEILTATIMKQQCYKNGTSRTEYKILKNDGLAFDHAHIITLAIERLRGKIEYTDVSFHLVPEKFTLTELQNVYEAVLDTELLAANFRRKISGKVEETDEYAQNAGHRPSKLFKKAL